MRSPGINGEGELKGQPANAGSPGKMAVKTECVCMCVWPSITEWEMYNVYITAQGPISEMTYTVSSGTLNSSIPYMITL